MVCQYRVDRILETRGNRRNKAGNKLFKLLWSDKTTSWEPLHCLVDQTTYLEYILPILVDYNLTAKKKPNVRRYCLCCKSNTIKGTLFCRSKKCCFMKNRVEDITFEC